MSWADDIFKRVDELFPLPEKTSLTATEFTIAWEWVTESRLQRWNELRAKTKQLPYTRHDAAFRFGTCNQKTKNAIIKHLTQS